MELDDVDMEDICDMYEATCHLRSSDNRKNTLKMVADEFNISVSTAFEIISDGRWNWDPS